MMIIIINYDLIIFQLCLSLKWWKTFSWDDRKDIFISQDLHHCIIYSFLFLAFTSLPFFPFPFPIPYSLPLIIPLTLPISLLPPLTLPYTSSQPCLPSSKSTLTLPYHVSLLLPLILPLTTLPSSYLPYPA